jgi:hypothetical protein
MHSGTICNPSRSNTAFASRLRTHISYHLRENAKTNLENYQREVDRIAEEKVATAAASAAFVLVKNRAAAASRPAGHPAKEFL